MFKTIAMAVAIAAVAGVAGAQGTPTTSKSAVKTTSNKAGAVRHRRSSKKVESQSSLQAEAKISKDDARATALKEVPNGTVKSSELERENGKLIYSFDISVPGKSGIEEINVNAIDGTVVNREHENAKAEKKEAAQEKKEAAQEKKATTKK